MTVAEIDTPALMVDLDVMERNLARVAGTQPSMACGCARTPRPINRC